MKIKFRYRNEIQLLKRRKKKKMNKINSMEKIFFSAHFQSGSLRQQDHTDFPRNSYEAQEIEEKNKQKSSSSPRLLKNRFSRVQLQHRHSEMIEETHFTISNLLIFIKNSESIPCYPYSSNTRRSFSLRRITRNILVSILRNLKKILYFNNKI